MTFIIHKPENGQGTTTSLAQFLPRNWKSTGRRSDGSMRRSPRSTPAAVSRERSEARRSDPLTIPLRQAGAVAREMLIQAAAQQWGIDKAQCRAENSTVINTVTNAKLSYGSLADAASKLTPPAANTIQLKPASRSSKSLANR